MLKLKTVVVLAFEVVQGLADTVGDVPGAFGFGGAGDWAVRSLPPSYAATY